MDKEQDKQDTTDHASPFKSGECKCGVPNCAGHEVGEDGKVHIPDHPQGHLVLDMSKHITD